jgi:hypothetical protein
MARVTIELYGIPRLRAGVASVTVRAASVREALVALGQQHPCLEGSIVCQGLPMPAYRVALNGDLAPLPNAQTLRDGDVLLLLATDAGG